MADTNTNTNQDPIVKASQTAPAGTSLDVSTTPVDVSALSGTASPFNLPSAPVSSTYDISTLPSISSLLNPTPTAAEQKQTQLERTLQADTAKIGGKTAAQITAEDAAARKLGATTGLSDFTTQLRDITSQIGSLDKQIAAAPLQTQDEFAGRGATAAGVAPIDAAKNRNLTVKRLGLSAVAETLQGNIASARETAARAVEYEFAPIQAEIDYVKQALADNAGTLSREDAKRAKALDVALSERQRVLDQQKADKTGVQQIAMTAAKYGAPSTILNDLLSAPDVSTAISLAGSYLQDPQAKFELQSAQLEVELKKAQIAKTYADASATTTKGTEDAVKAAQAAKDQIPAIQDKISSINTLLTSPGLNSAVGTSFLSRGSLGPISIFSTLSGARQSFIAGVQQLVSKDTLDTLVNLKAQGGTLGALSDQERLMLQSAASKIGTWAMHDKNGNVTGYNVDEADFKAELETIRTLAQRALDKAVGAANLLAPDEKSAIQSFMSSGTSASTPSSFNPGAYFNN